MGLSVLPWRPPTPTNPLVARPGYRVALVYPPFGPSAVPSLGLALLSAGLKLRGVACRTFYWNVELAASLGEGDLPARLNTYSALSNRHFMPWNEWAFSELVHGEALRERDDEARRELRQMLENAYPRAETRRHLEHTLNATRDGAAEHVEHMADRLAAFDLVGIGTTFYQNLPALALARRIKQRWPEKLVVLGGANCDGEMGRALAEKFPFLDTVFTGEVDHAFPDFVVRLSHGQAAFDMAGATRRDADGIVRTGPAVHPLQDLDGLPLPDFDDFVATRRELGIDELQALTLPLESSRGCWWGARHHCTFCGLNANGMAYRQKTQARFKSEVEQTFERYGARYLFMADNILSMDYFDDFMEWAASSPRPVQFFYEIKANANRRHVERLAHARVTAVQPGIESFSSSILALMRKGTTGIQNIAFLKYAREHGIHTAYNLIVGFPGEDTAEYDRVAGELRKLVHLGPPSGVPELEFHRFSPYHQDSAAFGIELSPSPKYQYLYPFPTDDVARLAYLFERRDRPPPAAPHLARFYSEVQAWHAAYVEGDCTLVWQADQLDVLIVDRRPGFPARRYRLRQYAVDVFRATDYPRPLRILIEEAEKAQSGDDVRALLGAVFAEPATGDDEIIEFGAREFAGDPERCLRPLVEAGLLYVEGERHLALPVHSEYRTVDLGWANTGV